MRSSLLSAERPITSSRQSPKMSAHRHGVALVPLFEAQPSAVSSTFSVSFSQSHLVIVVRSRISRSRSPSHQTPKLHERGRRSLIFSPLQLYSPVTPPPATQHS